MAIEIFPSSNPQIGIPGYASQDTNLLSTFDVSTFLTQSSYIEAFIYQNDNLISSNYNFTTYSITNDGQSSGNGGKISKLNLNTEKYLDDNSLSNGALTICYNFLNKKVGSNIEQLYISEISFDRTELRLDSTVLSNISLVEQASKFISDRDLSNIFIDFYLNFGDNKLIIANNIKLDGPTNDSSIIVKLYDPLPTNYNLKDNLWVVTSLSPSQIYQSSPIAREFTFSDSIPLQGPNFNLDIKGQVNNSTNELSYSDLISTSLTSSRNQLNSLLEEKEIDINIDFTNFSDFIHFSSAQTRLENFYYKVSLIEQYSSSLSILNNTNSSSIAISESSAVLENKIDNIITNFDSWDYYLYYSSGSWAWPKTTSSPPYLLATTGSVAVLNWLGSTNESSPLYGGILLSSSLYDENNPDYLYYTIPEYLRDDSDNQPYELFIDMVAQHYDNIWIYYKDVTQKYNNDNRLDFGISKDIVADAIRDFGIKLYQNNFSNDDLYTAFLGLTPEGALFPFPNITSSLPTPSGYEYVNTKISASSDYLPLDDVNKSLYKRIYHNLPYLLKSKGTLPGLRALITSYGIPDTILRINEYGGKDKSNFNDWDYWQDEFNYAFTTTGSNFITTPWSLNTSWNSPSNVPSTLEFRFKTNGLPTSSIAYSQSLWFNNLSSSITLTYTGSAYSSGSYSGSVIDPYYQYATLNFHPNASSSPNISASIYLPFYDSGWWSVMVNRSGSNFTLSAGNKIYEGGDNGTLLGFYTSSSVIGSINAWTGSVSSSFARGPLTISTKTYTAFSGSLQEIRYYNNSISENVFKDHIMNPYSIEGNSLNSSPNELAFRLPLGGELYTSSISIHPKITGSWTPTSSFVGHSSASFNSTPLFLPNREYFFYDQPAVGIKNAVSDKIRLENNVMPSGNTLSPYRSLAQTTEVSASYTANTNLLEVAFSPQDEINDDINSSIGYFNIGDFIGDPAFRSSRLTSYPDLDVLRNAYFEKYTKNYNLVDFIRLIKFFDNSLFKMIQNFVPTRTSLASGVVIKQHLLERNRYPQPQMDWENLDISGTLKPQWNDYEPGTIEHFEGGTGGSFEQYNYVGNISQSWYETYPTPSGSVTILHNNQDEFYNGEFSGSVILVTTQSLNQAYPLENAVLNYKHVYYFATGSDEQNIFQSNFLNPSTAPYPGEILFLCIVKTQKPYKGTFSTNPTINNCYVTHLKVAKTDCNGNSNSLPLGQTSKILIYNPPFDQYVEYNVVVTNESSDYYLYESNFYPWVLIDQIGGYTDPKDAQLFNYYVSSSITSSYTFNVGTPQIIDLWNTSLGNLAHYGTPYFNTSSGIFTFENTTNTPIQISASISINATDATPNSYPLRIVQLRDNITSTISQIFWSSNGSATYQISASIYPVQGDQYYIELEKDITGVFVQIISASLYTAQKRNNFYLDGVYAAPLTSSCSSVIIEPYITTPNYYSSDNNPLINNAVDERQSTIYQDVDYSQGALVPVNFTLLISGSATKATVQDSNYTLARHIIPRYEGSKSTSQKLNVWTEGDTGTYGKIPTIELNKVFFGYAETIGGYAPERMGSSGIILKYLIDQNGDIHVPNVSENSLYNTQGTFITNELMSISSPTSNQGDPNLLRKIIRGGQRIEPILSNQSGSIPGGTFLNSITLTDQNQPGNVTSNFQTSVAPSTTNDMGGNGWNEVKMPTIISSGSNSSLSLVSGNYRYKINAGMISEGVDIILNAELMFSNLNNFISTAYAQFRNKTTGAFLGTPVGANGTGYIPAGTYNYVMSFSITIPFQDLVLNHEYTLEVNSGHTNIMYQTPSRFTVTQSPTPNSNVSTVGLWVRGSSSTLYTANSTLIEYFNTNNIYQETIPNSGFFPFNIPWGLQPGDEFRFEGREDRVWMVEEAGVGDLSGIPILVIRVDNILPSTGVNYNQFLIRRYVDDASAIIFEGLKPGNADGPYIIRPQYLSPELNSKIDKYITDLTNKGLL